MALVKGRPAEGRRRRRHRVLCYNRSLTTLPIIITSGMDRTFTERNVINNAMADSKPVQ